MTTESENIFEQLGEEDAENLRLRAELMAEISDWINSKGLTQEAAAKILGTTQPRISDIQNGNIDKCSIDRLVRLLSAAGAHVTVGVSHAA